MSPQLTPLAPPVIPNYSIVHDSGLNATSVTAYVTVTNQLGGTNDTPVQITDPGVLALAEAYNAGLSAFLGLTRKADPAQSAKVA